MSELTYDMLLTRALAAEAELSSLKAAGTRADGIEVGGFADPMAEIEAERERQIAVEGWSASHDDQLHADGELLAAGMAYYLNVVHPEYIIPRDDGAPLGWPWRPHWWKPKDARRDLVRAGALFIAERDRLRRINPGRYIGHVEYRLAKVVKAIRVLDHA